MVFHTIKSYKAVSFPERVLGDAAVRGEISGRHFAYGQPHFAAVAVVTEWRYVFVAC